MRFFGSLATLSALVQGTIVLLHHPLSESTRAVQLLHHLKVEGVNVVPVSREEQASGRFRKYVPSEELPALVWMSPLLNNDEQRRFMASDQLSWDQFTSFDHEPLFHLAGAIPVCEHIASSLTHANVNALRYAGPSVASTQIRYQKAHEVMDFFTRQVHPRAMRLAKKQPLSGDEAFIRSRMFTYMEQTFENMRSVAPYDHTPGQPRRPETPILMHIVSQTYSLADLYITLDLALLHFAKVLDGNTKIKAYANRLLATPAAKAVLENVIPTCIDDAKEEACLKLHEEIWWKKHDFSAQDDLPPPPPVADVVQSWPVGEEPPIPDTEDAARGMREHEM